MNKDSYFTISIQVFFLPHLLQWASQSLTLELAWCIHVGLLHL